MSLIFPFNDLLCLRHVLTRLMLVFFLFVTSISLHAQKRQRQKIYFRPVVDVTQFYSTSFGLGISTGTITYRASRSFSDLEFDKTAHQSFGIAIDYAPFISKPAFDVRLSAWHTFVPREDRIRSLRSEVLQEIANLVLGANLLVAGNFKEWGWGARPEIGFSFSVPHPSLFRKRKDMFARLKLVYGYTFLFNDPALSLPFRGHSVSLVYYFERE